MTVQMRKIVHVCAIILTRNSSIILIKLIPQKCVPKTNLNAIVASVFLKDTNVMEISIVTMVRMSIVQVKKITYLI